MLRARGGRSGAGRRGDIREGVEVSFSRIGPRTGVEEDLLGGAGFNTSGSKAGCLDPARIFDGISLAKVVGGGSGMELGGRWVLGSQREE